MSEAFMAAVTGAVVGIVWTLLLRHYRLQMRPAFVAAAAVVVVATALSVSAALSPPGQGLWEAAFISGGLACSTTNLIVHRRRRADPLPP